MNDTMYKQTPSARLKLNCRLYIGAPWNVVETQIDKSQC